jgi:hypothetical protein
MVACADIFAEPEGPNAFVFPVAELFCADYVYGGYGQCNQASTVTGLYSPRGELAGFTWQCYTYGSPCSVSGRNYAINQAAYAAVTNCDTSVGGLNELWTNVFSAAKTATASSRPTLRTRTATPTMIWAAISDQAT